ncbi:amidohydrolase family protein [Curtobacterium sp. S6]|uniref:amidohydrolase family protein n=1 Tax=Curtobacterium sp. S6 TaxID=1479623 RepID=UPI0004A9FD20|nr:amidohydrolase family protein [Curtobacterium sp. S6]
MNNADRIDVHTHVIPPFWGEALPQHGGDPSGWNLPSWSPESALRFMDANGIHKSVLSLTAPGVAGWDGTHRVDMARRVNEYVAELAAGPEDRFGHFAVLPLPDVEGAVAEAEYALDEMKADGLVLLSNYEGKYLGDPSFESLWAALNERSAVVFVHPAHPIMNNLQGVPGPVVDYPFDTTRSAVDMAVHGILERYPKVRIILSHAGGFVPYAAMRFAQLLPGLYPEGPDAESLIATLQKFYWDTALSSGPYALRTLLRFAGPDKILFGSDYPYAPEPIAAEFTRLLDEQSDLSAEQLVAINHGNAAKLFN